ncbi:ATP10 protein-domain-containing protein [Pseudomassariella vexata]|uniref:ATP10 protein-domain-containing protein n=1 Tax=Pseudomassariella vexata TaxID=1141098 RepID=A0A1Y2E474_9PEZI|nr:ATP10 protein-domain-containing protein [Pseudomassariella vexata]ORY66363.1 ATP10 protein-domain-containing protein [Pseudomassariella vexata]
MSFVGRQRFLCLLCQSRSFSTRYRRLAEEPTKAATAVPAEKPKKFIPASPLEDAPRSYGKRLEKFTPKPLSRPIGLPYPPEPGQNTGTDLRTMKQRRDDFVNINKHLEKREMLKNKFSRPYFRDWGNLNFHKGKTFIAPPRPFKGDLSLYFPNLYGQTLLKTDRTPRDTTPTLFGKVSVVSIFSSTWAENQANTFISPDHNPGLTKVLEENQDRSQLVRVNIEEDGLKAMLIKLFIGGLRKRIGEANWDKYFIVRRGASDEIREGIGLLNGRVGYTYLLDSQCRIRWAGSGLSEDHEREGLVKGLVRLLNEEKKTAAKV